MNEALPELDVPESWRTALGAAAEARRILVLGPTDAGKTTFIRLFLGQASEACLIDLDPGQKMLGPPGTATFGRPGDLRRMIFLGTTSASSIGAIARATAALRGASDRFIVNTSGFVHGLGARLQAVTAAAIEPDLVVEIGSDVPLLPLEAGCRRLERSPAAARKSPSARRAIRQAAFEAAFAGASPFRLGTQSLLFGPASPETFQTNARPVCALADGDGRDMCLAILEAMDDREALFHSMTPPAPVKGVRLGRMWAEPREAGWVLLDKLLPSWRG